MTGNVNARWCEMKEMWRRLDGAWGDEDEMKNRHVETAAIAEEVVLVDDGHLSCPMVRVHPTLPGPRSLRVAFPPASLVEVTPDLGGARATVELTVFVPSERNSNVGEAEYVKHISNTDILSYGRDNRDCHHPKYRTQRDPIPKTITSAL